MSTTAIRNTSPRKLIDIPEDVFKILSMKAASMGVNLKHYIENLLQQEAEEMDDADTYRYLVSTRPEGKEMLSDDEAASFMKRNGIGEYR